MSLQIMFVGYNIEQMSLGWVVLPTVDGLFGMTVPIPVVMEVIIATRIMSISPGYKIQKNVLNAEGRISDTLRSTKMFTSGFTSVESRFLRSQLGSSLGPMKGTCCRERLSFIGLSNSGLEGLSSDPEVSTSPFILPSFILWSIRLQISFHELY